MNQVQQQIVANLKILAERGWPLRIDPPHKMQQGVLYSPDQPRCEFILNSNWYEYWDDEEALRGFIEREIDKRGLWLHYSAFAHQDVHTSIRAERPSLAEVVQIAVDLTVQAGFVGAWGEWHSSTNKLADNGYNEQQIVNALLVAVPANRTVQLRYVNDIVTGGVDMSLDIGLIVTTALRKDVLDANITHNLADMAHAAGIYDCLWRPRESGVKYGRDLIAPLETGLKKMKDDPAYFRRFDAKNGWGTYDDFMPWLENVLAQCKEYPDGEVEVSV